VPLSALDGTATIDFYMEAFAATERWRADADGGVVAGLSVDGAEAVPRPGDTEPWDARAPHLVGHTTVGIELLVDDPQEVQSRAIAAGAVESSPGEERSCRPCR
jgi:PhnB protein